jgi:HK97 family phage prohead protease
MNKVHYIVKRQEQTAEAEPSKVSFVASTATPDRYGDIIDQKGWQLDAYNKNPIVLLNHDSSQLPIGRGQVQVKNDQLVIDVEFDMDDPRAAEVARKTQKGFMNAVSVGFQPLQSALRAELSKDSPYYGKSGQFFKSAELLEVSIVTIPANGEATMITQKEFNEFKSTMLHEIRNMIRSELLTLPEMRIKHILEISEEEDRILISFAKAQPEEREEEPEMEEEQLEKSKDEEGEEDEDSTEDMPKSYHDDDEEDDDKRKNFKTDIDKIAELFAQII